MNKKGFLQFLYLILCIVLVAGLIVVFNLFGLGNTYDNLKNGIKEKFVSSNIDVVDCPSNIIPESLFFSENTYYIVKSWFGEITSTKGDLGLKPKGVDSWLGEDSVIDTPNQKSLVKDSFFDLTGINRGQIYNKCHRGSSAGENVNNIYCSNLIYYKEEQPISASGEIGKKIVLNYTISFEMAPVSSQEEINNLNWEKWDPLGSPLNIDDPNLDLIVNNKKYNNPETWDAKYYLYINYSLISAKCVKN